MTRESSRVAATGDFSQAVVLVRPDGSLELLGAEGDPSPDGTEFFSFGSRRSSAEGSSSRPRSRRIPTVRACFSSAAAARTSSWRLEPGLRAREESASAASRPYAVWDRASRSSRRSRETTLHGAGGLHLGAALGCPPHRCPRAPPGFQARRARGWAGSNADRPGPHGPRAGDRSPGPTPATPAARKRGRLAARRVDRNSVGQRSGPLAEPRGPHGDARIGSPILRGDPRRRRGSRRRPSLTADPSRH